MSSNNNQQNSARITAMENKIEILNNRIDAVEVQVIGTLNNLIDEIKEYHKFNDLKSNEQFWHFKYNLHEA